MVTSLDSHFVGETWADLKVANAKLLKSAVCAVGIEPTTSSSEVANINATASLRLFASRSNQDRAHLPDQTERRMGTGHGLQLLRMGRT